MKMYEFIQGLANCLAPDGDPVGAARQIIKEIKESDYDQRLHKDDPIPNCS